MKTIRQFPNIAVLFGSLAIATSVVLIFETPKIINYSLALFWFVTGLLAFYTTRKKHSKQN
jgi:uncharacterized membrane protein